MCSLPRGLPARFPGSTRAPRFARSLRQASIGAGTMGGGIAMNFANAGIPVTIVEHSSEALERGIAIISRNYATTVSRGRMTKEAHDRRHGTHHALHRHGGSR